MEQQAAEKLALQSLATGHGSSRADKARGIGGLQPLTDAFQDGFSKWKGFFLAELARPFALAAALAACCAIAVPVKAQAQAVQTAQAAKTPQPKAAHPASHKKQKPAPVPAPTVAPVRPPDPPPPDWPVNDKAEPANVTWNGRDLLVSAANSSLQQILRDVSTATGLKVEGANNDQRIFGSFGPAPARDVLSSLLDGSGYNILMVGDQGQGMPRELVLTAKSHGAGAAGQANGQPNQNGDEEAEEPEPPEQPEPPVHRPMMPPGQRTPQQMMQEMQQRRQMLLEQQQGQQLQPQANPNQPPPN